MAAIQDLEDQITSAVDYVAQRFDQGEIRVDQYPQVLVEATRKCEPALVGIAAQEFMEGIGSMLPLREVVGFFHDYVASCDVELTQAAKDDLKSYYDFARFVSRRIGTREWKGTYTEFFREFEFVADQYPSNPRQRVRNEVRRALEKDLNIRPSGLFVQNTAGLISTSSI